MNRFVILNKARNVKMPTKKHSWYESQRYWRFSDRVDTLYTLACFLQLREKIKKEVDDNYLIKDREQLSNSIVKYGDFGAINFGYESVFDFDLQPMIEKYVNHLVDKIESHTLKLEL